MEFQSHLLPLCFYRSYQRENWLLRYRKLVNFAITMHKWWREPAGGEECINDNLVLHIKEWLDNCATVVPLLVNRHTSVLCLYWPWECTNIRSIKTRSWKYCCSIMMGHTIWAWRVRQFDYILSGPVANIGTSGECISEHPTDFMDELSYLCMVSLSTMVTIRVCGIRWNWVCKGIIPLRHLICWWTRSLFGSDWSVP